MILAKKKNDILYWGSVGLILYMPLHYYICEVLITGTNLDNILRDAVILLMTAMVFFHRDTFTKPVCVFIVASSVMLTGFGLVSVLLNRIFPILNILRTYLVPMLIFFVARSVCFTNERFKRLNTFLAVELALVAVYGFIQAFFLGSDFLVALGYPNNDGQLSHTYYISYFWGNQRTVGTFVGPNICGIILAIALCVLLYTDRERSFRWCYVWGTMLVIGLVSTLSRSSWVGFAMGTAFYVLMRKSWQRLSKRTWKRAALVVLTAGVFLLLDWLILDSLVLRMTLSQTLKTFTGEDPSANAHIQHITKPDTLVEPPAEQQNTSALVKFFMGFGKNGPMAEEFLANPRKVESSYYLMQFEVGILGALVYFVPYIVVILQTIKNRKVYPYFVPAIISLGVLASYVFLPNVQTFEVPFYCFLFIGLYNNRSVKALYTETTDCEGENSEPDIKEWIRTGCGVIKRIPMLLTQFLPRDKDLYIFGAWLGQKFSDNSRALFLYALKHSDKKCYWICNNKSVYQALKADGLPVLTAYSLKGLYIQARAGVAFSCVGDGDFCRQMLGGCTHISLWHGVGGGKTIGMDDREYRENALSFYGKVYGFLEKRPLRKHYFVATGETMKNVFKTAFLIQEDHFIMAGQPRNDMFYDDTYVPATINHSDYGGKKVIVYMPTHRKSGQEKMDMTRLLDLAKLNAFCRENNAVFLIKKHFYHRGETEDLSAFESIIDITDTPMDSNELLMAADYLISDYSSCTADYLLLDRPLFYYCFDYEGYIQQDREMYWDYDSITPGPRSECFSELLEHLKRAVAEGKDDYREERKRVRDMFYDPQNQCMAADKILMQVSAIMEK